eukprot:scaffold31_cov334-Pavlova_lutheri.AAC.35
MEEPCPPPVGHRDLWTKISMHMATDLDAFGADRAGIRGGGVLCGHGSGNRFASVRGGVDSVPERTRSGEEGDRVGPGADLWGRMRETPPGTSPWVDKIGRTSMGDPMGTKGEDPMERERLKGRRGCLPGSERAS